MLQISILSTSFYNFKTVERDIQQLPLNIQVLTAPAEHRTCTRKMSKNTVKSQKKNKFKKSGTKNKAKTKKIGSNAKK